MRPRPLALLLLTLIAPAAGAAPARDAASVPVRTSAPPADSAAARALLERGQYADAERAWARLARTFPEAAAIGIARCRAATGAGDQARGALRELLAREPRAAAARAELAGLEFARGEYAAARAQADSALALDDAQPQARWWAAELDRVAGRLEQANDGYVWFVRFYNQEQDRIRDPETLRWCGLGAAQYARWNHNSGQFDFLVNTLYPDALKLDSTFWQSHLDQALLFIEKYNQPDARAEIDAGLRINPRAAELHAARALIALQRFDLDSARASLDRALALNPRLAEAHRLRADAAMLRGGPLEALPLLEAARRLDPVDEETLGRLAAVQSVLDRSHAGHGGAGVDSLTAAVVRRNPHCGAYFAAMGASFDFLAKLPDATRAFEEARQRMPQLISVPGSLGLEYMRLGEEDRARATLKEAAEADPFNVRVRNSIKVLELLEGYRTIETPHFAVRFDPARDSALAAAAADSLERSIYPQVSKALGFAPPGRTLIEIFSAGRRSSGHTWFSVRMAGLPFIGTVGASTGRMLAITSPAEGDAHFEWARVLRHEFVHIVNQQQTDFGIPRWYTEGMATKMEAPEHPALWDTVLAHRVAAHDLFDLGTINLGFLRPSSGEDWVLAYDQARLYVVYVESRYGTTANARLIAAYAKRLETRDALRQSLGVEPAEFEKGYRAWLEGQVAKR